MCGYRIGEASHPGPSRQNKLTAYFGSDPKAVPPPVPPTRDTCVVAVINPTSVLHEVPLFLETEADVLALAETSAVEHTQQVTGRALSRHNFRAHWGRAVPCHRRDGAPQHCLRGLAAGVALFSRLPSRASRPPLPEAALETCRLSEAFVRFGALEVRMLTVYCWPLSHLDAPERNEHLLSMALQRATSSAVPCIVAGDFNQPLQKGILEVLFGDPESSPRPGKVPNLSAGARTAKAHPETQWVMGIKQLLVRQYPRRHPEGEEPQDGARPCRYGCCLCRWRASQSPWYLGGG